MRFLSFLVLLVLSTSAVFAAPAADSGARDMHDARYGEILVVTGRIGHLKATVYSTIGLNDCPESAWRALDPAALKQQLKAWAVVMNGPRHFLMNRIVTNRQPGPVVKMGDLDMRALATIDLPSSTVMGGLKSKPYQERLVNRDTEWVFDKGTVVYELVNGKGEAYVMQSYAQIVDPSLTESDLPVLGQKLTLPKGWTYRSHKLTAELRVKTVGGKAHVLQDDLQNTYQLEVK